MSQTLITLHKSFGVQMAEWGTEDSNRVIEDSLAELGTGPILAMKLFSLLCQG